MTAQLASLLRSSLDVADRPLVPLEQEVQTVRDYLEIERVRFGDRMKGELRSTRAQKGRSCRGSRSRAWSRTP